MQRGSSEQAIYTPAEDTFFFAGYVEKESGCRALEIGSGSGYLTRILEKNFTFVVGTDIHATSLMGQQYKIANPVCCDAAEALRGKFDLVVCNMPYLPSDTITDRAVDGGPEGLQVPLHIVRSARSCVSPEGKVLLLTSSLANHEKLVREMEVLSFAVNMIGKKRMFFEDLLVLEAVPLP